MNIRCVLEWDDVTKSYGVYCPELVGLTSCWDTQEEAVAGFKDALSLYFTQSAAVLPLKRRFCRW